MIFRTMKNNKLVALFLSSILFGCSEPQIEHGFTPKDIEFLSKLSLSSLPPPEHSISNQYADNVNVAKLGHQLFFDEGLSSNGAVACNSCHQPNKYFTDGLKVSKAVGQSKRNAPSILSGSWSQWLYWDGRKDSVWSQALGPLEDPQEHNFTRVKVLKHVAKHYRQNFEELFGPLLSDETLNSISSDATPAGNQEQKLLWSKIDIHNQQLINHAFANVGKSLMAYQRQLKMPLAPFDEYVNALKEDRLTADNQLNQSQLNGLRLFLGRANCASCHNGPLFSNFEFHNIGAPESNRKDVDLGRFSGIQSLEKDEFTCLSKYSDAEPKSCLEMRFLKKQGPELVGAFKTPSLRNVSETAPYMQTGQFASLEQVVKHYDKPAAPFYSREQHPNRPHFDIFPLKLSEENQNDLIAFLKTLTSPVPTEDVWWKEPI